MLKMRQAVRAHVVRAALGTGKNTCTRLRRRSPWRRYMAMARSGWRAWRTNPLSAFPFVRERSRREPGCDANPLAHLVTNVVITSWEDDVVRVISKGIGVRADGTVGSVVYHDELRREGAGWRIARRRVSARRTPLRR